MNEWALDIDEHLNPNIFHKSVSISSRSYMKAEE